MMKINNKNITRFWIDWTYKWQTHFFLNILNIFCCYEMLLQFLIWFQRILHFFNWLNVVKVSVFRYSAWEYREERGQFYLHQFVVGQPDLNYRNPKVLEEMKDVFRFWLDLGVDGFRMDAVSYQSLIPKRQAWSAFKSNFRLQYINVLGRKINKEER